MSLEIWIAFVIASSAVLAIPGPTVILVVSYALGQGRSSGWATVPGVTLGDFTAMTVSLLGAGAVLAASAELFLALKLLGAAYLIWLGIRLWRSDGGFEPPEAMGRHSSYGSMFWNSWLVTSLNPKSIVFFVAFVPQFINNSTPVLPQFIILEATFLSLAAFNVAIWAVLSGSLSHSFRSEKNMTRISRIGGSCLIGAGLITAALDNSR